MEASASTVISSDNTSIGGAVFYVAPAAGSWRCIGCGKVHAPHIDTCQDDPTPRVFAAPGITVTTVGDIPCAHQSCGECGGSGTKRSGGICAHFISCPCPRCTVWCL